MRLIKASKRASILSPLFFIRLYESIAISMILLTYWKSASNKEEKAKRSKIALEAICKPRRPCLQRSSTLVAAWAWSECQRTKRNWVHYRSLPSRTLPEEEANLVEVVWFVELCRKCKILLSCARTDETKEYAILVWRKKTIFFSKNLILAPAVLVTPVLWLPQIRSLGKFYEVSEIANNQKTMYNLTHKASPI